ncbi:MAG: hypothetical protein FWD61_18260 [Phycisphaerales bacterium]|nr:hypothetical protein [Phycisphaerales bacterium]
MNRSVLLPLALLVLLTPGLGGCIAFYSYKPIHFAVYDAETGQPIAGASVHVRYMANLFSIHNPPRRGGATTDRSGRAKLDMPTPWGEEASTQMCIKDCLGFGLLGTRVEVSAHGYIEDSPKETGQKSTPQNPVNVYLYKEPLPEITFVVPDGYRGPLMIDLRPAKTRVQDEPGKRTFTFQVSPSGYIRIDAAPLLFELDWSCLSKSRFVYKSGTCILKHGEYGAADPNRIAVRILHVMELPARPGSGQYLFVVGTESDAKEIASDPKAWDALFDQSR